MDESIYNLVFEALGELSAVFMSQNIKGTEMNMPDEKLIKIGNKLVEDIRKRINNNLKNLYE